MQRPYEQMLTPVEQRWVREIVEVGGVVGGVNLDGTWVSKREYCDEGLSVQFASDAPQLAGMASTSGYIGRVVITTEDHGFIEARLDHKGGQLRELFVLFVDSSRRDCRLPYHWIEQSHEVSAL